MADRYQGITERPGSVVSALALRQAAHRYALIASRATEREVLEVACGTGVGLGMLLRSAAALVAGDISRPNLREASSRTKGRVGLAAFSAEALPFRSASFDVVALMEVIYYVEHPDRAFREAHRVLRAGGELILSTVNAAWRDFQPSPLSLRYLDSLELREALADAGFDPQLLGAFTVSAGVRSRATSLLRRLSWRAALPWPSWARGLVRRVVHGPPARYPSDLAELGLGLEPMSDIAPGERDRSHQILYAIARKS